MSRVLRKVNKAVEIVQSDGITGFVQRSSNYVYYRQFPERRKKVFKDILFINGCALEGPTWYRVNHQMEQLVSAGLTVDSVFYDAVDLELLKYYRGFIFVRCPVTDTIRSFIEQAKFFNKTCFFDIDDLVIDTKYTNQIEYIKNMPTEEKAIYDDGVNRMQETLLMCDYAITTTKELQQELKNYSKEVYINRNVASDEIQYHSLEALKTVEKDKSKIVLGYFSGSITHNEDFEMIIPSLVKILKKYENVYIKITGIIDIPKDLVPFKERIIGGGFYDFREFPAVIATCDIALAPLTNSIFNAAKSENKWLLPALVKVPTIATKIGAFEEAIEDGVTGILVEGKDWSSALDEMIVNIKMREDIGENAFKKVTSDYITVYTGYGIGSFIRSHLKKNIGIVLPSSDISGGVNVALKHADILRRNGADVTIIDGIEGKAFKKLKSKYEYRQKIPGYNILLAHNTVFEGYHHTLVATLWSTLDVIKKSSNVTNRLYFVQSFETDFYAPGTGVPRFLANASYCDATGIEYITMSLWCKKWLKEKFQIHAKYAPNGLDLKNYNFNERKFKDKIKILIEGDSKTEYKNTDEAFRIVEKLNKDKYEIHYLSYRKEPKEWYHVDYFYNRIPPEEVGKIYAKCDILLKTSLVESFSYPPLEMMATGGFVVVIPNGGNVEYLKDEENCLMFESGEEGKAIAQINRIISDAKLRKKLSNNGKMVAENYAWVNVEEKILKLYA